VKEAQVRNTSMGYSDQWSNKFTIPFSTTCRCGRQNTKEI